MSFHLSISQPSLDTPENGSPGSPPTAHLTCNPMLGMNWVYRYRVNCSDESGDIVYGEDFVDHNGNVGIARRLASVRVAAEIQRRKEV